MAMKYCGAQQDYLPCQRRHECLQKPDKTKTRQVTFLQGKRGGPSETDKMKIKLSINMQGKHNETYWSDEFPKAIEWLFFNTKDN